MFRHRSEAGMSVETQFELHSAPRTVRSGLADRLVDACCMVVGLLLAGALCAVSLSALLMANAPAFKTRIPGPDQEILASGASPWSVQLAGIRPASPAPPAATPRTAS
jgi:hypothetical protein